MFCHLPNRQSYVSKPIKIIKLSIYDSQVCKVCKVGQFYSSLVMFLIFALSIPTTRQLGTYYFLSKINQDACADSYR